MSTTVTTRPNEQRQGVVGLMGMPYLSLALVARLPFAMMVVGTLTLLVERGESVATAGAVSAVAGIGTAVGAPLLGRLVERWGQRGVLLLFGTVFCLALLGFVWLVATSAPVWASVVAVAIAGVASPQVAPMSRSRVTAVARVQNVPAEQLDRAMGYESMADEGAFVVGPVLVGAFSVTLGPFAPLLVAAGLTATAVAGFAVHPTGRRLPSAVVVTGEASARLFTPRFGLLALGMLLVGAIFGATLTALTSDLEHQGLAEWTGLIYGGMSVGSILSAASISRIPQRVLPRQLRWVAAGILGLAGLAIMALSTSLLAVIVGLVVLGLGVGASLVSIFSYTADSVPQQRHTSAFAMLASGLIVSQAVVTAGAGQLVTEAGASSGFIAGMVLGAVLLLTATAEWILAVKRHSALAPSRATAPTSQ